MYLSKEVYENSVSNPDNKNKIFYKAFSLYPSLKNKNEFIINKGEVLVMPRSLYNYLNYANAPKPIHSVLNQYMGSYISNIPSNLSERQCISNDLVILGVAGEDCVQKNQTPPCLILGEIKMKYTDNRTLYPGSDLYAMIPGKSKDKNTSSRCVTEIKQLEDVLINDSYRTEFGVNYISQTIRNVFYDLLLYAAAISLFIFIDLGPWLSLNSEKIVDLTYINDIVTGKHNVFNTIYTNCENIKLINTVREEIQIKRLYHLYSTLLSNLLLIDENNDDDNKIYTDNIYLISKNIKKIILVSKTSYTSDFEYIKDFTTRYKADQNYHLKKNSTETKKIIKICQENLNYLAGLCDLEPKLLKPLKSITSDLDALKVSEEMLNDAKTKFDGAEEEFKNDIKKEMKKQTHDVDLRIIFVNAFKDDPYTLGNINEHVNKIEKLKKDNMNALKDFKEKINTMIQKENINEIYSEQILAEVFNTITELQSRYLGKSKGIYDTVTNKINISVSIIKTFFETKEKHNTEVFNSLN